jgi:hypothetical protein
MLNWRDDGMRERLVAGGDVACMSSSLQWHRFKMDVTSFCSDQVTMTDATNASSLNTTGNANREILFQSCIPVVVSDSY